MSENLDFAAFMKSPLHISLGRQIQLAACVFALLPATLATGPAERWMQRIDLALRGATTPTAIIAGSYQPVVIEITPAQQDTGDVYRALLERMDYAASVTIADVLTDADDALAEAIRYNGSVYLTDAQTADGNETRDAAKAAARGIGHSRLPRVTHEFHAGLQAWRLSGNNMRASAALMPLLPDPRWRDQHSNFYGQPDLRVIPMLLPDLMRLSATDVLAEPLEATTTRFRGRHIYIGSSDTQAAAGYGAYHSALASGQFLQQPRWASTLSWLILAVGLFLLVSVLWRESRRIIASVAATITLGLLTLQWLMANFWQLQVDVATPLLSLLAGFSVCFVLTPDRRSNRRESFRNGLRYLRADRLDAAFAVFRSCPPHPSLIPTLYKLAIAFEKRSQPEQARAVFAYMSQRDKNAGPDAASTSLMASGDSIPDDMPETIGRYEVLRPLGSGAMAGVMLGRDPRINRLIALKIVSFDKFDDEAARIQARSRFFQEAESAGRLTHPAITAVYDSGEENGLGYIALEYVPGVQMTQHTAADALLEPMVVLRAITRVAEALDYAHSEHVVHRDIKPANLLFDPEMETLKITDFGVAKLVDAERTQTGIVLGTPSYMSPEQANGDPVTGSSDLFSLGVTLYELLTGGVPFRGKSIAELMTAINTKTPRPVSELREGLPPGIDAFMERALAKRPENRFSDGNEMAFALRECASQMFAKAVNQ